ncbi:hypothetical protein [Paraflavitalea speifideaquila]|uniref:hypothetical protein n=1 Tax=Paraflavitalea speifideaquila TaxID=3076558 RepID=UPI0028E8C783|nr:hypothetical protein [Paraflavitalea speifideiaquila]
MLFNNPNIKKMGWFYLLVIILAGWMTYANLTGWKLFYSNAPQTWSSSGPGYHK